jgi:hypothetical protein
MTDSKPTGIIKKVYTKPQLTEVRLVAQEAVLGVCKTGILETGGACLTCASTGAS